MMQEYIGVAASGGIAIGEVLIYNQELSIPKYSISPVQAENEIDRFYKALRKAKSEYEELQRKIVNEMSDDEGKFLDAHILMTEDTTFISEVTETIRDTRKNIEWVLYNVVESISKKFSQINDEYFQERAIDIIDLGRKIMRSLLSQKAISLTDLQDDVIIVSTDLTVSDTASMNKKHVLAFVTEIGGKTSHSAILASSLAIPAVLGISNISHIVNAGDKIIVDGFNGKIIVNPDETTVKYYIDQKQKHEKRESESLKIKDEIAETLDNHIITLKANMEIPEQEIDSVLKHGAEGIGLYRSEFLYLSRKKKSLPSEEQQFNAYKFILEKMHDKPVTIRTLDLGGDKLLEGITERELNPYLGWRAIRFCLDNPNIFKIQLRALYRASVFGNLKILLPMISTVEELIRTKKLMAEVRKELKKDGFIIKDNIQLGIMIETPAAVMISDELAKNCDFFSIGSNDLIQYTLACDRGNAKVASLYQPLHVSVLKLIKITIENAHKNNIKVSLCGEMASDIENAVVLIGLGIDELSMGTVNILNIKRLVKSMKYSDTKKFVEDLLKASDQEKTKSKVKAWIKKQTKYEQ